MHSPADIIPITIRGIDGLRNVFLIEQVLVEPSSRAWQPLHRVWEKIALVVVAVQCVPARLGSDGAEGGT